MSFCEVSDVFEEDGPPTDHFHGGFGLLNLQGIRKPSFFAYRFLSMLGNEELTCDAEDAIVSRDARGYQILMWDPSFCQDKENILYYGNDLPPKDQETVVVSLKNVLNGTYTVRIYAVGYRKNDAYTAFLQMPHEDSLSREQVDLLKRCSDGRPETEFTVDVTDGTFEYTVQLRENDVYLIMLERS